MNRKLLKRLLFTLLLLCSITFISCGFISGVRPFISWIAIVTVGFLLLLPGWLEALRTSRMYSPQTHQTTTIAPKAQKQVDCFPIEEVQKYLADKRTNPVAAKEETAVPLYGLPTEEPTPIPTRTPAPTATPTDTPPVVEYGFPTPRPTATPEPSFTFAPLYGLQTPTPYETPTPTKEPTAVPTSTAVLYGFPTPTATREPTPTWNTPTPMYGFPTASPSPSMTPTPRPSMTPTAYPTETPVPTEMPTETPVPTATWATPTPLYGFPAPRILVSGYMDTKVGRNGRNRVKLVAFVNEESHANTVEIYLNGQRSGLILEDDGLHGDFEANDSIFGIELQFPILPPLGKYLVELKADNYVTYSPMWPYLNVE